MPKAVKPPPNPILDAAVFIDFRVFNTMLLTVVLSLATLDRKLFMASAAGTPRGNKLLNLAGEFIGPFY